MNSGRTKNKNSLVKSIVDPNMKIILLTMYNTESLTLCRIQNKIF